MLDYDFKLRLPTTLHPKVRKVASEFSQLKTQLDAELQRLDDLGQDRQRAEETDRLNYAAAIRAGKEDPGIAAVDNVDQAITATRRKIEALEIAVADSRKEVMAAIERHREAWLADIDNRVDAAATAFRVAVEAMAEAHAEAAEALTLRTWLTSYPRLNWKPGGGSVRGLVRQNGEPTSWATVVDALRTHADALVPTPRADEPEQQTPAA